MYQRRKLKKPKLKYLLQWVQKEDAKPSLVGEQEEILEPQETKADVDELKEEETVPAEVPSETAMPDKELRPVTLVERVMEGHNPEMTAEEYVGSVKEVYMIPSIVKPEYEPSVVEKYRA